MGTPSGPKNARIKDILGRQDRQVGRGRPPNGVCRIKYQSVKKPLNLHIFSSLFTTLPPIGASADDAAALRDENNRYTAVHQ